MLFSLCNDMEGVTRPRINNLKVHVVLTQSGTDQLKKSLLSKEKTTYNNLTVVRQGFTYIVFPEKGFINITGVQSFDAAQDIIPQLEQVFGLRRFDLASDIVVDNISAAGDFTTRVNLVQLQKRLNKGGEERNTFFSVHFDRNFFPGAFCKTRGFGTLTVFPSGKYVVVGAKCLEHVEKIVQRMCVTILAL